MIYELSIIHKSQITNPDNQQLKMDILQQTVLEVLAERIRSEIS